MFTCTHCGAPLDQRTRCTNQPCRTLQTARWRAAMPAELARLAARYAMRPEDLPTTNRLRKDADSAKL